MGLRDVALFAGVVLGCGPSKGTPDDDDATTDASTSTTATATNTATSSASTVTSGDATTTSDATTDDDTAGADDVKTDFWTCAAVTCEGAIYACFDGDDNDGDGLVDLADPECTGICDDDEHAFQSRLPADVFADGCAVDCQFDGNGGSGDDLCEHRLQCDPEDPGAPVGCEFVGANDPNCAGEPAPLVDACLATCRPLTPPGCDCFGCCTIETPDGPVDVFIEGHPDCSLTDLAMCPSCTSRIDECGNTCDACEICIGGIMPDPACRTNSCDEGSSPCSSTGDCGCGEVCHLGCCRPVPTG